MSHHGEMQGRSLYARKCKSSRMLISDRAFRGGWSHTFGTCRIVKILCVHASAMPHLRSY